MSTEYLRGLNPEQRQAAEYGVAENGAPGGPLLIIAGAGCGKTNTLAHRVAHAIMKGADPRRILLMTFSRRGAKEMTGRAEGIIRRAVGGSRTTSDLLPWAGTFHATGTRLLREFAPRIGIDSRFTIHDSGDSADLMNVIRIQRGFSNTNDRFPAKDICLKIYSRCVNAGIEIEEALEAIYPTFFRWAPQLKELFAAYVEAKQAQNVLDYDDLLLYWAEMLHDQEIAEEIAGRFDHILVDEYQDTNRLQASILLTMKPEGQGLAVVGDDAQSIYSFRAATVHNILEFPDQFSPAAEVITLNRNYRSTQPILAAANGVISLAKARFTKDLWSDRPSTARPMLVSVREEPDQASYVVERVLENRENGMMLKDQAVLFRASHHSGPLELELTRRNIPFVKYGGLKFLEAAHIKDVLALLRFIENPRDRVTGFRVLLLIPGIGAKSADAVLRHMLRAANPLDALIDAPIPVRARGDWDRFLRLTGMLASGTCGWPAELEQARLWYEPYLELKHEEDATVRRADLVQLEQIAFGFPSRERFLTELTLDPPNATSDLSAAAHQDDDNLILSTIHSAKGQEWRSVFVLNAVDGCIPSDRATGTDEEIEEERRIFYVAMTRAKENLALVVPQRFFVRNQAAQGDGHVYASRTRFIPEHLTHLFERASWPVAHGAECPSSMSDRVALVDVRAKMRRMWK